MNRATIQVFPSELRLLPVISFCAIFVLVPIVFTSPANAANCWAPDQMQEPDPAVAKAAPVADWKKDFAAVASLLKKLKTLEAIPEKRLGVTMYLGHPYPGFGNSGRVSAGVYPPKAWEGECGLGKGAEFFNNGHVHVTFNEPRAIFQERQVAVRDDSLTAYIEPKALDMIGNEIMYDHRAVILTPDGIAPWVPVPVHAYLRAKEQEIAGQLEQIEKSRSEAMAGVADTIETAEMIREMEKVNADLAKEMRKSMVESRAMIAASFKESEAEHTRTVDDLRKELADIKSYVNGLSPEKRDEPTYLGDGRWGMAPEGTEGRGRLVKLNPALDQGPNGKRRIQLIVVQPFANDQSLVDELTAATKEVDFAALRALIR